MVVVFRCRGCFITEAFGAGAVKPLFSKWWCGRCPPGIIYTVTQENGMYSRVDEFCYVPDAPPKPVECICSTMQLMRGGCPKRRGGVCRD